jgi:hypothetical protein
MSKQKAVRLTEKGPPCPRCHRLMQIRVHTCITDKMVKRQPYYYSRWYYCLNNKCRTKQVMPDEFRVFNESADTPVNKRLALIKQQLGVE